MSQLEDEDTKEHAVAVPPPPVDSGMADDGGLSQIPPPMPPSITAAPGQATPLAAPDWQDPAGLAQDRPPTEPVPTPPMAPPATSTLAAEPSQQWPTTPPQTGQWQQPAQVPQQGQWQQPAPQQWQGSPQYPAQPGYPPPGYQQPGYPPPGYPQPGYAPQGYAPTGPMYSTSALVAVAGLLLAVFGLIDIVAGAWLLGQAAELGKFIDQIKSLNVGVNIDKSTLRSLISPMPGVLLVWGALEVVLGVGIFAHKGWARAFAILLSLLGLLVGIAGVSFALALAPGFSVALIAAVVVLLGYAFIVLALIAGGGHFRRRYPQR